MKSLSSLFNMKKGDVVSLVGSGGKTSLMFKLAHELKTQYKVLITTSTRIYMPVGDYDIYTNVESFLNNKGKNNITVIAKNIDNVNNKLIGINNKDLDILKEFFDIILIEADGSRKLPLKGWKKNEPVILSATNKTIGILPGNLINKNICADLVYCFDEFNELIDGSKNLDFDSIRKIICKENGLFKNSKGILYLFFNQVDTKDDIKNLLEFSAFFKKYNQNLVISCGSLKKEEYYEC